MKNKYSKALPTGTIDETKITPGVILLQGGSSRGVFTCGVLDCLMQNDINIKDAIGVSAESLNGFNYLAGKIGRAARIPFEFVNNPKYIGPIAYLKNKGLFGFDFIFHGKPYKKYPISFDDVLSKDRELIVATTDINEGKAAYYKLSEFDGDFYDVIQASSSIGLIAKQVSIHGHDHLDGGYSASVPINKALELGYKKIVVVLTMPLDINKFPLKEYHVTKSIAKKYKDYPNFLKTFDENNITSKKSFETMMELNEKKEIFVIAPNKQLDVTVATFGKKKLSAAYWQGYNLAKELIPQLKEYLEIN